MKLTREDYIKMFEQVEFHKGSAEVKKEGEIPHIIYVSKGSIEFKKDGETLHIEYVAEEDNYKEGEYDCTTRDFRVTSYESYNEAGDKTENDFNEDDMEMYILQPI